ncbi:MAG: DNA polymerase III subunit delta [Burkholderiaceae bacterium]
MFEFSPLQTRFDPLRPEAYPGLISGAASKLSKAEGALLWAVCGDDPYLQIEAADQVRHWLTRQGYAERISETPDRFFRWRDWFGQTQSGSLFASQRLFELRLPTGRPGLEGAKVLGQWIENPPEATALLLHLPRLDKKLAATQWLAKWMDQGVVVTVETPRPELMSSWIEKRLQAKGLKAGREALALMASQFEGNYSAAHQELEKLAASPRANPQAALTPEELAQAISNHARYNAFQFAQQISTATAARSIRVLRGLKEEGEPLPLIVWACAQACRRLPENQSGPALQRLSRIDTMTKGIAPGDPWSELERLVLTLAP